LCGQWSSEAKDATSRCRGREEALLFKKGIAIRKIPQDEIVKVLKDEILAWIKETVKSEFDGFSLSCSMKYNVP
jgi:hypothetical protein